MHRKYKFGLSVAALCGVPFSALAADVIASNTANTPVAQIGVPRPISAYVVRAQKDDKPTTPVTPEPATQIPFAPTPTHTPMPGTIIVDPQPAPMAGPIMAGPGCATPDAGFGCAPMWAGWFGGDAGDQQYRFFVGAEYLYWWVRDGGLPPLVTTATPALVATDGAIGKNATLLYGNDSMDTQGRNGVRANIGYWFGDCKPWAIESSAFFLGQRTADYSIASNASGSPVIARPFFNPRTNMEDREIIAYPNLAMGNIAINSTQNFYGADVDFRRRLWCGSCFRVDGTVGFRYLNLDEDLNIREQTTYLGLPIAAIGLPTGATTIINDNFKVDNDFYGGYLGLLSTVKRGRWTLDLSTRIGLGSTRQHLDISGNQQVILPPPNQSGTFNGGLLARPTNIGSYDHSSFSVVPEGALTVGYQATPHIKLTLGYNFLYWTNVLRVGDQVDRTVDPAGIPFSGVPAAAGTTRPAVVLKETDFWAQGISTGMLFTW